MSQRYTAVERFVGREIAKMYKAIVEGAKIRSWDVELPDEFTQAQKDECGNLFDFIFNSLEPIALACLLFGVGLTEAKHQGVEYSFKAPAMVEEAFIGRAVCKLKESLGDAIELGRGNRG